MGPSGGAGAGGEVQVWIAAGKRELMTTGRGKGAKMQLALSHRGGNEKEILSADLLGGVWLSW